MMSKLRIFSGVLALAALVTVCHSHTGQYLNAEQMSSVLKQQAALSRLEQQAERGASLTDLEKEAVEQWKDFTRAYQDGNKNVFQMLARAVQGQEHVVRQALRPVFKRLDDGEQLLEDVLTGLRLSLVQEEEEDSLLCTVCSVSF